MSKLKNINWLHLLFFGLAVYSIVHLIYILDGISVEDPDTNLAARNIETPIKLWINGYLGLFFGFKYLGNINWLLLPLGTIFLLKHKFKLPPHQWALIAFFLLAFGLIALKGFFNFRYALTLFAFSIFMVFYLLKKVSPSQAFFLGASVILLITVFYHSQRMIFTPRVMEKIQLTLFSDELIEEEAEQSVSGEMKKVEHLLESEEIKGVEGQVLVNNLPDFYYLTEGKGLYYWSGDDLYFDQNGKARLFDDRPFSEVKEILSSRSCTHIYTHASYVGYGESFDQFIAQECRLILEDIEGRQLFEIQYE